MKNSCATTPPSSTSTDDEFIFAWKIKERSKFEHFLTHEICKIYVTVMWTSDLFGEMIKLGILIDSKNKATKK